MFRQPQCDYFFGKGDVVKKLSQVGNGKPTEKVWVLAG
jgi:hypothetical protein